MVSKKFEKQDPPLSSSQLRVTPHDLEVERQVIGQMLLHKDAIGIAQEVITTDDFHLSKHQLMYDVILEMDGNDLPCDILTLTDTLTKKDIMDKVGGEDYLLELATEVVSWANIKSHCEILQNKSTLRQLITSCTHTLKDCYSNPEDISNLLDTAEASMFKIGERQVKDGFQPISQILTHTFEMIESYSKMEVMGVPSGLMDLDKITGGFQKTDLIILAGRPAMGKTAITLSMMANSALRHGKSVAYFSLEMGKEQLVQRILCREARVNLQELRTGRLPKSQYGQLLDSAGALNNTQIYIDDSVNQNPLQIRSKCRRLAQQHGLDMVIIDYLQLMTGAGKQENRTQEISQISRSLKALAKELKIPVIALSQLNRSVESRPDGRPVLSDLRESGSIEQDADIVMFIYREEMYKRDDPTLAGKAQMIIAKQRNGTTGEVDLTFIKEYASFENYSGRAQGEESF